MYAFLSYLSANRRFPACKMCPKPSAGCRRDCDGLPSVWVGLCDCHGTELAEDRLDEAAREAPDFPDRDRLLRDLRERQENRDRKRQQKREAMRAA